jgi:hypothetical protein
MQIICTAKYENFYYAPPPNIAATIPQQSLLQKEDFSINSVAGTGFILYKNPSKILLLTCHHIIDFADTVKTYYLDSNKKPTKYLYSLSVKYDQTVFTVYKSGPREIAKVLLSDNKNDLALIEGKPSANTLAELQFQGIFDESVKIRFGQEIYLLGFPKNTFMVTKGLASPSTSGKRFVVDAPFNKGFSGGVVISFDETGSKYQYLGMANSSAIETELIVAPSDDPEVLEKYKDIPYEGDLYTKKINLINYGISYVISIEVITDFLKKNKELLDRFGYNFSHLIKW